MNSEITPVSTPALAAAWAGLDVSKKEFDVALYFPIDADQPPRSLKELPVAVFPHSAEGVADFLRFADEQLTKFSKESGLEHPPALRVVMEATGRYSIELSAWIVEARAAARPAIIQPKAASDFGKSLRVRNVNDQVSARYLARYGYDNKPEPPADMETEYAELRALSRERDYIVATRVAAENRLEEVGACKTAAKIHNKLVKELTTLEKQIDDEIKKLIKEHAKLEKMMRRLQTIPGVGWKTAVAVVAEAGDLCRFARSRQLGAFAGLSPRTHDSGTSVHKRPRLSKQGSGRLRKALYMSALTAVRDAGPMRDFYDQLLANHKPKMVALLAVARKQLLLMRALLVGESDYQADYVSPRNQRNHPQPVCA
jgi:transposase